MRDHVDEIIICSYIGKWCKYIKEEETTWWSLLQWWGWHILVHWEVVVSSHGREDMVATITLTRSSYTHTLGSGGKYNIEERACLPLLLGKVIILSMFITWMRTIKKKCAVGCVPILYWNEYGSSLHVFIPYSWHCIDYSPPTNLLCFFQSRFEGSSSSVFWVDHLCLVC